VANDGSVASQIEQYIADVLAALSYNDASVFRTAAIWTGQVSAVNAGAESFTRYAPFAFVGYIPDYAGREGDGDLRRVLEYAVMVGQVSLQAGVARCGDADSLGTNMLEELVIAALDRKHPGNGLTCDNIRYVGTTKVVDAAKISAVQLNFNVNLMTD